MYLVTDSIDGQKYNILKVTLKMKDDILLICYDRLQTCICRPTETFIY